MKPTTLFAAGHIAATLRDERERAHIIKGTIFVLLFTIIMCLDQAFLNGFCTTTSHAL